MDYLLVSKRRDLSAIFKIQPVFLIGAAAAPKNYN